LPESLPEVTMTKKKKKLHGTVNKVIKPIHSSEKEKAEIDIQQADDLYREIRVDNEFVDEKGKKASLKPGQEVDIVIEADSDAMLKKPE
jgi:predicted DNA-binding antitoxin AbrB/MazE fold protein